MQQGFESMTRPERRDGSGQPSFTPPTWHDWQEDSLQSVNIWGPSQPLFAVARDPLGIGLRYESLEQPNGTRARDEQAARIELVPESRGCRTREEHVDGNRDVGGYSAHRNVCD